MKQDLQLKLESDMRLRSHLIEIASVVVLAAFAGSNALAQGSQTTSPTGKASGSTATQPATKGAGATAPSSGPWTADNVTAARPFGDINISAAGTSTESVRTWVQGRSASERAELSGRCAVITNSSNAARYPANAQQFCRSYMMVASANPPAGKGSPTTR